MHIDLRSRCYTRTLAINGPFIPSKMCCFLVSSVDSLCSIQFKACCCPSIKLHPKHYPPKNCQIDTITVIVLMSLLIPIARRWRCLPDIYRDKTVRLIKSWEGKFASISFILQPSYQSDNFQTLIENFQYRILTLRFWSSSLNCCKCTLKIWMRFRR